jgi:hypothetical protein
MIDQSIREVSSRARGFENRHSPRQSGQGCGSILHRIASENQPTTRPALATGLPKLTGSQIIEQNSEHPEEPKLPANNPLALNAARCKAVYTGSIRVVALRSAFK